MSKAEAEDAAPGHTGSDAPQDDLAALARDWVTLWQSELAAMARDRELQEGWQTLLALWAGVIGSTIQAMPRQWPSPPVAPAAGQAGRHEPPGGASPAVPPGAAAAAAASAARDAEIERLHHRITELEQRLAGLEPARSTSRRGKRR